MEASEAIIEYLPVPGEPSGLRVSPLTLLRLKQLPQLLMLERLSLDILPVEAECMRICSRSSGFCVEIGGAGKCLEAYAPLLPGLTPSWLIRSRLESSDTSEAVTEAVLSVAQGSPSVEGVYRPRLYHVEPLAVRVIRVEAAEYTAQATCIEWPGGALLLASRDLFNVIVEPGIIRVRGRVYYARVKRCSRGGLARLLNTVLLGSMRGPVIIRGDAAILSYVFDGEHLDAILWNPHVHPVYVEAYTRGYAVREARLLMPGGQQELPVEYNRVALHLGGETVARLQLKLRTLPPLLKLR